MIIRPFNAAHLLLLALAAGAGRAAGGAAARPAGALPQCLCSSHCARRTTIIGFFVNKGFLSRDIAVSWGVGAGLETRFNWFSELADSQLCNIPNMFLHPRSASSRSGARCSASRFFRRGARRAHGTRVFRERRLVGYSLWLPRMLFPAFTPRTTCQLSCVLSLGDARLYTGPPISGDIRALAGNVFFLLGIGAWRSIFYCGTRFAPLATYFFVYGGDVAHQYPLKPVLEVAARAGLSV